MSFDLPNLERYLSRCASGEGAAVPQQEMETYSEAQLEGILQAAPDGWPRMVVQILLGTGMRVSELCALKLADVEDEGEVS